MADEHRLEYFLLQYVPNIVRGEVFNVAVVLLDPKDLDTGFCRLRCVSNWQSRVLAMDPDADIAVLSSLLREIEERLSSQRSRADMLQMLEDSFSNAFCVSRRREYQSRNPALDLESLASRL